MPPGSASAFDAGGDVDALSVNVLAVVDDVTEVHTHAEVEWTCP